MKKIVGVRFKPAGKIYDFESGAFVLNQGDHVIVETEQGLGLGVVVTPPRLMDEITGEKPERRPLKKVFRMAGDLDLKQVKKNNELERNAHTYCLQCIGELNLKMNLFSVDSNFDAGKLTFFFTAEGRVDFRELVKMLVKEFRTRIEMRQVGIRNQAKMCGGVGRCGRELCCSSFLEKFDPVSIRMAKEQGLSLNPTKISGLCGRLMCCLTYEDASYRDMRSALPKIGRRVEAPDGPAKITRHNVICNRVTVRYENGHEAEISSENLKQ